jgi:hypothetical protein
MANPRCIECARVIESRADTANFEGKRFHLSCWERMMAKRAVITKRAPSGGAL